MYLRSCEQLILKPTYCKSKFQSIKNMQQRCFSLRISYEEVVELVKPWFLPAQKYIAVHSTQLKIALPVKWHRVSVVSVCFLSGWRSLLGFRKTLKWNLNGAAAAHPNMLKVELTKNTSLDEQRTSEIKEKNSLGALEEGTSNSGGLQNCGGRKLEGPEPKWKLIWLV